MSVSAVVFFIGLIVLFFEPAGAVAIWLFAGFIWLIEALNETIPKGRGR